MSDDDFIMRYCPECEERMFFVYGTVLVCVRCHHGCRVNELR